jgi:hypothetical protein
VKEDFMQDIIKEKLSKIGLPKWPQMYVFGAAVTVEQAKDTILRTDPFLTDVHDIHGGNNQRWNEWARKELGYAHVSALAQSLGKPHEFRFPSIVSEKLNQALGVVETEYVRNSWASSCYAYGPHGWSHPNGTIWYADNVGKWPEAEAVFAEWERLAAAFPYLDLKVTLMSGEYCELQTSPVVSFRVQNGTVVLLDEPIVPEYPANQTRRDTTSLILSLNDLSREQGLPNDWIYEYAAKTQPLVEKFIEEALEELKKLPFQLNAG